MCSSIVSVSKVLLLLRQEIVQNSPIYRVVLYTEMECDSRITVDAPIGASRWFALSQGLHYNPVLILEEGTGHEWNFRGGAF